MGRKPNYGMERRERERRKTARREEREHAKHSRSQQRRGCDSAAEQPEGPSVEPENSADEPAEGSEAMKSASQGDTVMVHYTGKLDNGTVFDSSSEQGPINVTIGGGEVLPGFESALVGMAEGDTKSVTLDPEDAYGAHDPKLLHNVSRTRIPSEINLEIGLELQASDQSGDRVRLLVVDLSEDSVTLDANHPLSGKALTFEIELVGFVP